MGPLTATPVPQSSLGESSIELGQVLGKESDGQFSLGEVHAKTALHYAPLMVAPARAAGTGVAVSAWERAADELKLDRDRLIARVLGLAERMGRATQGIGGIRASEPRTGKTVLHSAINTVEFGVGPTVVNRSPNS